MRYKSIIDDNNTSALQALNNLKNDISNNKPHATAEYIVQVINFLETKLENTKQYLDIED